MPRDRLQFRLVGRVKRLAVLPGVVVGRHDPEVPFRIQHDPLLTAFFHIKTSHSLPVCEHIPLLQSLLIYDGVPYDAGHGSTSQMPVAYSAIVRSLENFPEPATFKIALRAQASGSAYSSTSRW